MMKNKSYIIFAIVYGITVGVYNGVGTAVDIIVSAYGHNEVSELVGAMFIVGGLLGASMFGFYADKTH